LGFDEYVQNAGEFVEIQSNTELLSPTAELGLASCHGLNEINNTISGYPLELDMFSATQYKLRSIADAETGKTTEILNSTRKNANLSYTYVQRYAFDPSLQRSSVLLENVTTKELFAYVKGSPEAVMEVCDTNSLPQNFQSTVRKYSSKGLYCLGLATKYFQLPSKSERTNLLSRNDIESNLTFIGFILFAVNKLWVVFN